MELFMQVTSVFGFALTIAVAVMIVFEKSFMARDKKDILTRPEELYDTTQESLTRLFTYVVLNVLWLYSFMMRVFSV